MSGKEKFVLELSEDECEQIRKKAKGIAQASIENEIWGREDQLIATRDRIRGDTGASAYYLLKRDLGDKKEEDEDGYLH